MFQVYLILIIKTILWYLHNLAVAISQLINTILFGDPDETLCSRCGKILHKHKKPRFSLMWWFAFLVHRVTHLLQRNHVYLYREWDEGKNQLNQKIKSYVEKKREERKCKVK